MKVSKRTQAVIDVLKKRIDNCHNLVNISDVDDKHKGELIVEAEALRTALWLLTDDEYLQNIQAIY